MGYPIWFILIITQRGWKFKKETKRYKVYQSPTSVDRIIIHKKSNIDERIVRSHLRKVGLEEAEIQTVIKENARFILKQP